MNVLVICHGNICRSPVFSELLQRRNLPNLSIRQGALKSYNNELWRSSKASKKIRDKAKIMFNLSLESHRSRKLSLDDFNWCDYCIYFDSGNLRRIYSINENMDNICKLINAGELIGISRIKDPNFINKDSSELDIILNQINKSVNKFVEEYYK